MGFELLIKRKPITKEANFAILYKCHGGSQYIFFKVSLDNTKIILISKAIGIYAIMVFWRKYLRDWGL